MRFCFFSYPVKGRTASVCRRIGALVGAAFVLAPKGQIPTAWFEGPELGWPCDEQRAKEVLAALAREGMDLGVSINEGP